MNAEPLTNQELVLSLPAPARVRAAALARRLGQVLAILGLAFASYFLVSRFVVQGVTVAGSSMVPTLRNGERYLLNRWILHVRAPARSEIVVIRDPADQKYSVKRIIAVAGDSVLIKQGKLYVNGRRVEETYLAPGTLTLTAPDKEAQSITCGKDQFFLLGDNRNNSVDSRAYGLVSRRDILGLIIR